VPRFLTTAWVEAFNGALDGIRLADPGPGAGLAAAEGRFTVAQEVRGGPDGDLRLVLRSGDGALVLELVPMDADEPSAEVTVALSYADAVALAQGSLSPAEALNAGRIRVRGDLSVLVAGQELLVGARQYTRALDADTTY
jgi:putative sterol carrier protein